MADEPAIDLGSTRKRSAASAGSIDRPPSPSKRQVVGSIVSPVDSTPAAPAESGGSGSAKGHSAKGRSASRQSVVPKFVKPKKFVLKHSSQ